MTGAQLQLHIEPLQPIEIGELTGALTSLARQYNVFAFRQDYLEEVGATRLLVSSITPGSIDINFIPDLTSATILAMPIVSDIRVVSEFAGHIKWLLERFGTKRDDLEVHDVTVRDCDDAINIVKPIATHGGTQTFNTFNGPILQAVINVNSTLARRITEDAVREKARLQFPEAERRERVSMTWKRLDRDPAKSKGSSPDKALIEEIDPKSHSVFFEDALSYLKDEMIKNEDNPYQKVYFVDVEVSRVRGQGDGLPNSRLSRKRRIGESRP